MLGPQWGAVWNKTNTTHGVFDTGDTVQSTTNVAQQVRKRSNQNRVEKTRLQYWYFYPECLFITGFAESSPENKSKQTLGGLLVAVRGAELSTDCWSFSPVPLPVFPSNHPVSAYRQCHSRLSQQGRPGNICYTAAATTSPLGEI